MLVELASSTAPDGRLLVETEGVSAAEWTARADSVRATDPELAAGYDGLAARAAEITGQG